MDFWIIYFFKVNIALMVLHAFYKCMFNTDTFFRLRRGMLLLICVVAFVYPFCKFTLNATESPVALVVTTLYSQLLPEITILSNGNVEAQTTNVSGLWIKNILMALYVSGAGLLLLRTCVEIIRIRSSLRRYRKSTNEGIQFYTSSEIDQPCSFFHWIFINPEKYTEKGLNEILIHEQTHVREYHSIDIVLAQLIIVLCWFNPFAWLIRSEIRMNHEYLADKQVVNRGYNKKIYQYLLLGIAHNPLAAANLYNNFSVLPLKKRIKMLNRKQSSKILLSKYLMFIPVIALLIFFSNCTNKPKAEEAQTATSSELAEKVPDTNTTEAANTTKATESADEVAAVKESSDADDKIFEVVEESPNFPGGSNELVAYFKKNIDYPITAQESGKEGRVIAQFVVEKDGSISGVKVLRGVDPELDKEAVRVIKAMPKWTPGKEKGKVERVKYTVPVMFKLQ